MSKNVVAEAFRVCEKAAKKSDSILVGFSGGKESICTAHICSQVFEVVIPYSFIFLPDLACKAKGFTALDILGLRDKLISMPDRRMLEYLKYSMYRHQDDSLLKTLMPVSDTNWLKVIMAETGIPLVATGMRRKDTLSRRRMFARVNDKGHVSYQLNPISEWNKFDVYAYLSSNKLPIPDTSGEATFEVGLDCETTCYLHDVWPEDYERIRRVFPFVEAHVHRREFYGVGHKYTKFGRVKEKK